LPSSISIRRNYLPASRRIWLDKRRIGAGAVEGRPVGQDYIARKIIARKIGDLTTTPLGVDEDEEFRIFSRWCARENRLPVLEEGVARAARYNGHHDIPKPQIGVLPSPIYKLILEARCPKR
jgi:hypothetical protein